MSIDPKALLAALSSQGKPTLSAQIAEHLPAIRAARAQGWSVKKLAAALTTNGISISAKTLSTTLYRLERRTRKDSLLAASPHPPSAPPPPANTRPSGDPYQTLDGIARSTPDLNALSRRYHSTRQKGTP